MGEIKSTMDLVLERTKHLTMSEAEKADLKREEADKRLSGLIRRYRSGGMRTEQMKREMEILKAENDLVDDHYLRSGLLHALAFDRDNESLLRLLAETFDVTIEGFRALFREYREAVTKAGENRKAALKQQLAKEKSIRGDAVLPNLDRDEVFFDRRAQIQADFSDVLARRRSAAENQRA